jgi:lipopolysaccharide biosynthesis protein
MNRLAVYVYWEKDGIVRDYNISYLKGLTAVAAKIYVVVNGEIQRCGKQRIEKERVLLYLSARMRA